MKPQQKAEIKEVFGERMSTSLFINLIALFPKVLETIIQILKVWKDHKRRNEVNALNGGCGVKPKNKINENGDWECINGGWVWVDDLG